MWVPRKRGDQERTLEFNVSAVVDTGVIDAARSVGDSRAVESVVQDEVQSNLESVDYVRSAEVRQVDKSDGRKAMTIKFQMNDRGNPAGKLADTELHFTDGPLQGLKLIGFAVWERRAGGRTVTFPARQYSVNGERRSFALLRPEADAATADALRDLILAAYAEHEANLGQP